MVLRFHGAGGHGDLQGAVLAIAHGKGGGRDLIFRPACGIDRVIAIGQINMARVHRFAGQMHIRDAMFGQRPIGTGDGIAGQRVFKMRVLGYALAAKGQPHGCAAWQGDARRWR